jgi:phosphorylase kinase alpha/beta subunit
VYVCGHQWGLVGFFWEFLKIYSNFGRSSDPVIAMYCQPDENGTYARGPSHGLFLWGQSVFIIAQLLTGGLLHINELDPIRRYLPSYNRPRKGGRYSAFQVSETNFFVCGFFL